MFQHVVRTLGVLFLLAAQIFAQDTTLPTVAQVSPAPGTVNSLTNITVTFSEPVTGVNSEDFLIQGLGMAQMVSGPDARIYTFHFPQPPYGAIQIGWIIGNGIADLTGNPFNACWKQLPRGRNSTFGGLDRPRRAKLWLSKQTPNWRTTPTGSRAAWVNSGRGYVSDI